MEQPINNLKVYGVAAQILCQPNMLIDLSIPSRILLSEMFKKKLPVLDSYIDQ